MKIKLLFSLLALFFLGLQGMDESTLQKKIDQNEIQLKSAITYGIATNNATCNVCYFEPFNSSVPSAGMKILLQQIIDDLVEKKVINNENDKDLNPADVVFFPNEGLVGYKDSPEIEFYRYELKSKKWTKGQEDSRPSNLFSTDRLSKNCKLIVYNIPKDGPVSTAHHGNQIRGLKCFYRDVPLVLNVDSTIEDDSIVNNLLKQQKINAIFGVHHKKPATPFYKNETFIKCIKYCGVIIAFILFCLKVYRYRQKRWMTMNDYAG